ncbi:hypothetical protein N0V90_004339 [Kalmusia sp. IMI 367209]|nr:hypothetical protein N0V90_004339 [Kalmusia sp. IMI 367209]
MPSRKVFLREYNFPLRPAEDFTFYGNPASYAPNHPQEWGHERDGFNFLEDITRKFSAGNVNTTGHPPPDQAYLSFKTATSPDKKLLAISSGFPYECVLIYDIGTKELRQILDGCGTLAFRPPTEKSKDEDEAATKDVEQRPAYTLISDIPTGEARKHSESRLTLWELDRNGRLLVEEEPIDPRAIATKAIEAIIPELESEHEWSRDFVTASNLQADFITALNKASADHRRRHNAVIQNAVLSGFLTAPFSSDGKLLLYVSHNDTTQQRMRDPDFLPCVVVFDVDAGREVHRFRGHTDSVMWVGFSPDDQHVASVSWDGTLRMYSIKTGLLEWSAGDSGRQSWVGAFSPDSRYIVWSSNCGREIRVHEVTDGRVLSTFPGTINHWCRCFAWHPNNQQLALCAEKRVYIWRPFDGHDGILAQHWVMDDNERAFRMSSIGNVGWMDDGRLLHLTTSEGTTLVYDTLTNAKEIFKRPAGAVPAFMRPSFYELPKGQDNQSGYLSADGDGKVRYWNKNSAPLLDAQHTQGLPVAQSWWEKRVESPKRQSPKPEEHANITSKIAKQDNEAKEAATSGNGEREAWAEHGAAIWTE